MFGFGKWKTDKGVAGSLEYGEVPVASLEVMAELIRYFPIGSMVRYYPEFQSDIVLESIIVGYLVGSNFVFSPSDIHVLRDNNNLNIMLRSDGDEIQVQDMSSFTILIPETTVDTEKLDYTRRIELNRTGRFRRGNNITLVSFSHEGGTPAVDTEVRRQQVLKEGIYKNHTVALLDVLPNTLNYAEQRQFQRLSTRIPAMLGARTSEDRYPCMLLDFAEGSVRIGFEKGGELDVLLRENRKVILGLDLGDYGEHYVLEGNVQRRNPDNIIMSLMRLHKNGTTRMLNIIDALHIKSSLLKHPDTVIEH